ncbi:hypothetical protein RA307_22425 [Xanthobacteraceae bacterium Astr-EGSB]|uniref:hypothetical protein n=1 Tax=Astrobacterium formosum TaxID=3069710 RepID=UPI0027B40643|nr:hypothetical protein [Xanthobacteraceae bacterium Astr-EGSB]
MSIVSAVEDLRRLARDTARLARYHPCIERVHADLVAFSSNGSEVAHADEFYADTELILSDVLELQHLARILS